MSSRTWANISQQTVKSGVMYSPDGAQFQEFALNRLDHKGSLAYQAIGPMVTAINNGRMSRSQAESAYMALLRK